jgi:hypothetical protein
MHGQFVKGLHADNHGQREKRDDDTSKTRIDKRQEIRRPAFEFEPAPQQRAGQAERGRVG